MKGSMSKFVAFLEGTVVAQGDKSAKKLLEQLGDGADGAEIYRMRCVGRVEAVPAGPTLKLVKGGGIKKVAKKMKKAAKGKHKAAKSK